MGNNVKVLIGEINGQELDQQEEYTLQLDDLPTVDTSTIAPTIGDHLEWDGTNWVPAAVSVGTLKADQAHFFGQATVGNKWLARGASSKTSDDIPYVVVDNVSIEAISWSNSNDTFDITVEVYKNGTSAGDLIASYPIVDKLTMAKTNITPVSCSHGDRLSVYIKRNSGNSADPIISLYLRLESSTNSEVST